MMMSESYHFSRQCRQYDDNDEPWPDGSLIVIHYHHSILDLLKPPPDVKQGCCSHPVKIVINGASSNVKPMIRGVVFF